MKQIEDNWQLTSFKTKCIVAGLVAQYANLLSFNARIPAAPRLIQPPVLVLEKQQRMIQDFGPLHPHGRPEEAPGSWFGMSSTLAFVAIWGGSLPADGRLLPLSLLLIAKSAFQININKTK